MHPTATSNNRFERSRSNIFDGPRGIDDLDKVPSFDAGEAPRRSTLSLGDLFALTTPAPSETMLAWNSTLLAT